MFWRKKLHIHTFELIPPIEEVRELVMKNKGDMMIDSKCRCGEVKKQRIIIPLYRL